MITEVSSGQVFCLRNWAGCINSLRVKVTASYSDGTQKSAELDLPGQKGELEGLIIVVMAMPGSSGVFFIGADMGSRVTEFTLELENAGAPVRTLGLECASANAVDIFNSSASVEYSPMLCSALRFNYDGFRFTVEPVSSDEQQTASSPVNAQPETGADDIIGDIDADIAMLEWYSNSGAARQAAAELAALKERASAMPADLLAQEVNRYEQVLLDCIQRTRSDIRLYRDALIEDSMKK